MKRKIPFAPFLPILVLASWACAGNPGPGETGYAYNLSGPYRGTVMVEGMAFSFNMEMSTAPGGAVAGEYRVMDPVVMSGSLAGTLAADTVTFSLNYLNPMDGCGGVLQVEGTVDVGGSSFSGRGRVNDSCYGFLTATVAMRR
jgi:hypothetical protein